MKMMKYLASPTKVVFIKPHKYVCTNSKGKVKFWGSPSWNGLLHCLPTAQPMQKSSWQSILAHIPMARFFYKRSFKFCSPKWPNLSCQLVKSSFSQAT